MVMITLKLRNAPSRNFTGGFGRLPCTSAPVDHR